MLLQEPAMSGLITKFPGKKSSFPANRPPCLPDRGVCPGLTSSTPIHKGWMTFAKGPLPCHQVSLTSPTGQPALAQGHVLRKDTQAGRFAIDLRFSRPMSLLMNLIVASNSTPNELDAAWCHRPRHLFPLFCRHGPRRAPDCRRPDVRQRPGLRRQGGAGPVRRRTPVPRHRHQRRRADGGTEGRRLVVMQGRNFSAWV